MNAPRPILAILTVVACTAAAGAQGHGQNFFFVEETALRLPPDTTLPGTSSTDVDLVDVDADGDLDLFVAEGTDSPAPRPNRLLLNKGIGVFTDVSATHLPPGLANSLKADFGDVDADGDLDAIVANLGPEQLLINDGTGVFSDETSSRFPVTTDTSRNGGLADLDGDGDLDLMVGNSGENGRERVFVQYGRDRPSLID